MSRRAGIRVALIVTIVATIGCDRVTKHIASTTLSGTSGRSFLADSVRFAYAENTGGFLSLGADLPPATRTVLFTVATGLVLLGLAAVAVRFRRSGWPAFGLTLSVAGGMSNWFDRAVRGSVVDFMNVGVGPLRTGVFNVADVAIMFGVAIVIVCEFRRGTAAQKDVES
jgi:signal peptidase II